jgi:acyl-coenzyme A thioesterase PaaI-like protein
VSSPQDRILGLWRRLAPLPGGRRLFAWILGWSIPYSATIGARIRLLEPGHCILVLRDRRAVRNHLRSIHAVAITNAGELASGLAMTTALPTGTRAIVTHLATEYLKKARGAIVVECRVADPPRPAASMEVHVESTLTDAAGDIVARVKATWRVAPPEAPRPR